MDLERKLWEEMRRGVYCVDGSVRDIYVLSAGRADWAAWVTCVNAQFPVRWWAEGHREAQAFDRIAPETIAQRWDGERLTTGASIQLGGVQANCHFFVDWEIENDVDPKEFHSWADHERLLVYPCAVSTALGKEVFVTEENDETAVWFRVNGSAVNYTPF